MWQIAFLWSWLSRSLWISVSVSECNNLVQKRNHLMGFVESFRQLWRRILQFVKVWSHCDRHISIYFFASFSYLKEKLLNRHSACLRSVLKYSQFKYASTLSFLLLKVRYFYNYCRVLFWRALVTFWAIKINFLKILERWKLLNYLNGVATENFTIS